MLGIAAESAVDIQGEIGISELALDAEAFIRRHLEGRFDLRRKRSEIEGYRLLQRSRRAGMAPDVSRSFTLGGSMNGPFSNPWFGSSGAWVSAYPRLSLSLCLPVDPLLPGSRLREEMAKTDVEIEAAELTIESLVENLDDKMEYISVLRLNVELARKAAGIAEEDYALGRTDLQTVEEAQLELEKAEAAVLEEEYNFVIALLDLEYALNAEIRGAL
jgi:outer membrane protein TolC